MSPKDKIIMPDHFYWWTLHDALLWAEFYPTYI